MATAKEQLDIRDKLLDEYEKGIGLSTSAPPGEDTELESYLSMDRSAIESLSIEDCDTIAIRLSQFAFHIQRSQNREQGRVTWAKSQINLTTATELQEYKGFGREEKLWQAIQGNEYALKVHQIQVYAEQRVNRLSFIASGLNNLAELIKSMKFNKMRAEKNEQ